MSMAGIAVAYLIGTVITIILAELLLAMRGEAAAAQAEVDRSPVFQGTSLRTLTILAGVFWPFTWAVWLFTHREGTNPR